MLCFGYFDWLGRFDKLSDLSNHCDHLKSGRFDKLSDRLVSRSNQPVEATYVCDLLLSLKGGVDTGEKVLVVWSVLGWSGGSAG